MSRVLFRVVDLETSGLAPPASIIEMGWTDFWLDPETKDVDLEGGGSLLFSPAEPLTSDNIAVHHLTNEALAPFPCCEAPSIIDVMTGGAPQFLVAANASFEQQWITPALTEQPDGKQPRWICTVKAAARLHPDAPSHSNQAMRYELGLNDLPEELAMPPHRAQPDSYVTALILTTFIQQGATVSDMVRWTQEPRLMTKLPFGKHKGVPFTEAPGDYLVWILKQADLDPDAKHWARLELDRRRAAA